MNSKVEEKYKFLIDLQSQFNDLEIIQLSYNMSQIIMLYLKMEIWKRLTVALKWIFSHNYF